MSRKKWTDIVGVIKFRYDKEPLDLAAVVTGCVQEISWSGIFSTSYVKCRRFKVLEVALGDGVASVVFEVGARPSRYAGFPLGSAAVTAVWQACNYRFGAGAEGGLSLLPLEDAEIRTGAGNMNDLSADKLLDEMMKAAERLDHVSFGWLESDLFHRYVACIGTDEQHILARMPEGVRSRYLQAKARLFRWMKPAPGESTTEGQA